MKKELHFDLEFTNSGVNAVSPAGKQLLFDYPNADSKMLYMTAVAQGLHVRFEHAQLRDAIAQG